MTVLIAAAAPAALGLAAVWAAPHAARRLPPAVAAIGLTALALTVALATGLLLCMTGALVLAEASSALRPDDWTVTTLRRLLPVPPVLGLAAGLAGLALLALAVAHLVRAVAAARRVSAAARDVPTVEGLTIVDDDALVAYAVPGRHAHIVVSTSLLRTLSPPQRRALLAHERSHLRHRHHLYAQLALLAAAANPLMRPAARAVHVALERWADDDAAREVGDRRLVAHALGAASLAGLTAPGAPTGSLAAGQHAVVERVRLLLAPPPRRRIAGPLLVAAAVLLCWLCTVLVVLHVHGAIELAEAAARR